MLRLGAVSYLNTKPLIYQLDRQLGDGRLTLDLPSRLADQLAAAELDIALIPSVEFFRGEGLRRVSNACIACLGDVRSVRLLFRKPPQEVRSLALDEGSRTSAALSQVLLAKLYGLRPELRKLPMTAAFDQVEADALLVIGDRAMRINAEKYVEQWDLGQSWYKMTGLPFVFASWVARSGVEQSSDCNLEQIASVLEDSRDRGLAAIDKIIQCEAEKYRLTFADCKKYLTQQLHFTLGVREQRALELFRSMAAELELVPENSNPSSTVVVK